MVNEDKNRNSESDDAKIQEYLQISANNKLHGTVTIY